MNVQRADLAAADRRPLGRFDPVYPPAPARWTKPQPIWRTLLQVRRSALPTWGPIAYREPVLAGTFLGNKSFLLNAPHAIRRVLVDNHANYGRTPGTLRILHPMIGDGLLLAEGERWKRQRKATAPAFAPRSLNILADVTERRLADTFDRLDGARRHIVSPLRMFQQMTLEIAGEALFSDVLHQRARELRRYLDVYGRRYGRPSPFDFILSKDTTTPLSARRYRYGDEFRDFLAKLVRERAAIPPADPPRDLFEIMLAARDEDGNPAFPGKELGDQVATLLFAGHETTALSLFWATYLLALAPDVQQAVAEEADAARAEPDRRVAADKRMPLARAVVQEALRLYPPAFTVVRRAIAADRIDDREVPPNSLMVVAPFVLHRHTMLWDEPERFDPSRFLPGATPPDRYAYLPFGIGPRVCIGMQFALIETTLAISELCRRYAFEIVGHPKVLPLGVVTTIPDRDRPFRLRPRAGTA